MTWTIPPLTTANRDSDQIDTASQLVQRVAVRNRVPSDDIQDDRLTFDIDLADGVSAGNNLVFSVLLFAAIDSAEPDFVARQGAFTLPAILGQIVSLTLGAVELVQFGDTTVNEGMDNAAFTGTLTPSSPRAVVINVQTQDGTGEEFDAATAGEDFTATSDTVRFEPGVTEEMLMVPVVNDIFAEATESFGLQLQLDLQFPTKNRIFIMGGSNGGTFGQVSGTITDDDDPSSLPPPDTSIRFQVLLSPALDAAQAASQMIEVWVNDLDDSPFSNIDGDSDQVDTATRILDRTATQDVAQGGTVADPFTFDIDLANGVSAGDNLVFSVLMFPDGASPTPSFVARQGAFDLPDILGDAVSMAFGAAEIVNFNDASVSESQASAAFTGTITPTSPRAVVLNVQTQDGTSAQADSARAGEDYEATTDIVRFEAGESDETIIVPILNDAFSELTETFDVLLELDIQSPTNNRAYIASGLNGGTFGQVTGTITDDGDSSVPPPPAAGIRLAVALPPELSVEQAGAQRIEIWLNDIDDSPFTNGSRDRDQIDIALRLQNRAVVQDLVLDGNVSDPLTFDIDLANELSIGDNFVISVLLFPTDASAAPTFIARQGPFDLDDILGQTSNLILGTAEIVQFNDTTVNENAINAAFAGTITPASDRAVAINFRTQNGTTPQVGSARSGQDYDLTNSVVRFDSGETVETIIVPIIDDDDVENTESFDVQLELDIRFPANNRAFLADGVNGGTFGQLTGTITDND